MGILGKLYHNFFDSTDEILNSNGQIVRNVTILEACVTGHFMMESRSRLMLGAIPGHTR